jgi:hypothetical protein
MTKPKTLKTPKEKKPKKPSVPKEEALRTEDEWQAIFDACPLKSYELSCEAGEMILPGFTDHADPITITWPAETKLIDCLDDDEAIDAFLRTFRDGTLTAIEGKTKRQITIPEPDPFDDPFYAGENEDGD